MPKEVEIRMDAKSLCGFVLYHNFMRPGGIIGIFLSVAAIVALIVRWGAWTNMQRCLLILLALLFLIFQPLMLMQKANKQLHSPVFATPMTYLFEEKNFSVMQEDKRENFTYTDIRKAVFHKNVMYLYMTAVSAFIIPRSKCGDAFDEIKDLIRDGRKPV